MERNRTVEQADYRVPAGRLLRLLRARGWTLQCVAGTLLLTQEEDARDFTLGAGEELVIGTQGRVLVESVGPGTQGARVRLARAARAGRLAGQPVVKLVKLVKPSSARAGMVPGPCTSTRIARGTPTTESVFSDPRLLEQLVREAHRERNVLIGAVAVAMLGQVRRWILGAGRMALAGVTVAARLIAGLRPRLPTLQETFAARVFLRSRL